MASLSPPKTIYTLWLQGLDEAPDLVKFNMQRWKDLNPEYRVTILVEKDIPELLGDTTIPYAQMRIQAVSNVVRTKVLLDHGGIWVDATLLPVRPLRKWLPPLVEKTGFFAFHSPGPDRLLSSWFLPSVPGHPILQAWWNELVRFWDRPRELVKGYPENPTVTVAPDGGAQENTYHYHAFHYLFGYLVETNPEIARHWEACGKLRTGPSHHLYRLMRQYPGAWEPVIRLVAATSPVQKLNWREPYDLRKFRRI